MATFYGASSGDGVFSTGGFIRYGGGGGAVLVVISVGDTVTTALDATFFSVPAIFFPLGCYNSSIKYLTWCQNGPF